MKADIHFCEECEEIASDFCKRDEHEISSFVYLDSAIDAIKKAKIQRLEDLVHTAKVFKEKHNREAIAFFEHLKNHKEVQEASIHKGIPVCKICGKSSKEILSLLEYSDNGGKK